MTQVEKHLKANADLSLASPSLFAGCSPPLPVSPPLCVFIQTATGIVSPVPALKKKAPYPLTARLCCVIRYIGLSFGSALKYRGDAPGGQKQLFYALEKPIRILAGQYYDGESGLHYNWHRYYDPEIGRYLIPDPIGLAGGINLYHYSLNRPLTYIDPDGRLIGKLLLGVVAYLTYKFINESIEALDDMGDSYTDISNAEDIYNSEGELPDLQNQQLEAYKELVDAFEAGNELNDAASHAENLMKVCK